MSRIIIVPAINDKGESNWPERWPIEALRAKEKEIGSLAFSSQYMLAPVDLSSAPLSRNWLKPILVEEFLPSLTFFFGVDPSPGDSSTSDNFALAVLGGTEDRSVYVLMACYRARIGPLAQANFIVEQASRWHPQAIVIEAVSAQKLFTRYFFKDVSLPIREARATNIPKALRITNLASRFERGEIFIRGQVSSSGEVVPSDSVRDFVEEFANWNENAKHDDTLDAVDKALEAAGIINESALSIAVSNISSPSRSVGEFLMIESRPSVRPRNINGSLRSSIRPRRI